MVEQFIVINGFPALLLFKCMCLASVVLPHPDSPSNKTFKFVLETFFAIYKIDFMLDPFIVVSL